MKDGVVQIGLIGCGVVSGSHARAYQMSPRASLRWACDLVPDRADRIVREYGAERVTTRFADVLDDPEVDAVSICTDHASHATIAIAALARNRHVLCEKSLAANEAGLDAMLAAHAKKPDLVFSGVFQHRFDPIYRELKAMVDAGRFGRLLTLNLDMLCLRTAEYYRADPWRGTWAGEGGSVLINQAIHFIDLARWIGGGIEALSGIYANRTHEGVIETEDTAAAAVRYGCGALGVVSATSSSPVSFEPTLSINGENGSVQIRSGRVVSVQFRDPEAGRQVDADLTGKVEELAADQAKAYYGMGHGAQIEDFLAAIQERRAPYVTAESAADTVRVILGWYASHRRGGWVDPRPAVASGE